jgi:hypothetical protein
MKRHHPNHVQLGFGRLREEHERGRSLDDLPALRLHADGQRIDAVPSAICRERVGERTQVPLDGDRRRRPGRDRRGQIFGRDRQDRSLRLSVQRDVEGRPAPHAFPDGQTHGDVLERRGAAVRELERDTERPVGRRPRVE